MIYIHGKSFPSEKLVGQCVRSLTSFIESEKNHENKFYSFFVNRKKGRQTNLAFLYLLHRRRRAERVNFDVVFVQKITERRKEKEGPDLILVFSVHAVGSSEKAVD